MRLCGVLECGEEKISLIFGESRIIGHYLKVKGCLLNGEMS